MTITRISYLLLLGSLLICTTPAAVARTDSSDGSWLTFGFGGCGSTKFDGPAGSLSASYLLPIGFFSARVLATGETRVDPHTPAGTVNDLIELSLTYGAVHRSSVLVLSGSAGLGVLWMDEQGSPGVDKSKSIGLPVIASAILVPVRHFGIGVSAFGTLNTIATYGGITACISIGDIP